MTVPVQPAVAPTAGGTETASWAFHQYLDGSWVDIGSMIVAVGIVFLQRHSTPQCQRCAFFTRSTARDLASALTIFPLLLLTASSVFTWLTPHLLNGSRITLTIAGGYALFAMLEDLLQKITPAQATSIPEPVQVVPAGAARAANDAGTGVQSPPSMAPAKMQPANQLGAPAAAPQGAGKKPARKRNRSRKTGPQSSAASKPQI